MTTDELRAIAEATVAVALHEGGIGCDLRPNQHGVVCCWADHYAEARRRLEGTRDEWAEEERLLMEAAK